MHDTLSMWKMSLFLLALRFVGSFPLALHPKRRSLQSNVLKRVDKNVYQLNKDVRAWNVDGSSNAKRPSSSWIGHWEHMTGLTRDRLCSYSDCNTVAKYGGHVWLKGHGVFIAPLCQICNRYWNAERMQNMEGNDSFLRKGTTVVRVEYSDGMKKANRRFSLNEEEEEEPVRRCSDCNTDISDRPDSHTRCLRCFRSSRAYKANAAGKRREDDYTRLCINCRANISEQPENHRQCPRCFAIMTTRVRE